MSTAKQELIKLYSKQLRLPTFTQYEEIERQLSSDENYEDFLIRMMKRELEERSSKSRADRIKKANFPKLKTIDEYDMSRLEHVSEGEIRQLASCEFIKQKQNVVMIGNPGSGKTYLSIALGGKRL